MTERETLKLALEALQNPWKAGPDGVADAIIAIKEALAQPEHIGFMDSKLNPIQRTWVGLTDEDIALIDWESLVTKKDCVQAIEAKLKEKNK